MKKTYTVKDAIIANKNGKLTEWVLEYLLSEGNTGLAKALNEEQASLVEIAEYPLSLLQKIDGPEEVNDRRPPDIWEQRVTKIEALIKEGNVLPPLIVTDFWKPLDTHRQC